MKNIIIIWIRRFCHRHSRPSAALFEWSVGPVTDKNKTNERNTVLNVEISNEQKVLISISPKSHLGKAAAVDPKVKPTWTPQSGQSSVDVAEDGMSAMFTSSDTPGDTVVLVSADADLGDGVETISDQVVLTVTSAKAESLGLTAGTPEDKPSVVSANAAAKDQAKADKSEAKAASAADK